MRRFIRKFLLGTAAIVVLLAAGGAAVLSHDADCPPPPAFAGGESMRAIVHRCYGGPDVLALEVVAKPTPRDDELLVRVHAASANPLDWHSMRGTPYVMRLDSGIGAPASGAAGVDFAGTVEAVGRKVTRFKPGDAVFGGRSGAFAEYVVVGESRAVAHKPANLGFDEAATVGVAATTALQALRDHGAVRAGHRVLINGASGGVGTYAVQIAKALGAEVTAVCSTRNVGLVRTLGADHVVDYTRSNFTQADARYDLIVDLVGSHGLLDYRRVLTPNGRLVIVGGPDGKWLGPMAAPLKAIFVDPFVDPSMGMMLAELKQSDLDVLAAFMREGKVRPVIDRVFALDDTREAIRYLEQGRARGKVVIRVGG